MYTYTLFYFMDVEEPADVMESVDFEASSDTDALNKMSVVLNEIMATTGCYCYPHSLLDSNNNNNILRFV